MRMNRSTILLTVALFSLLSCHRDEEAGPSLISVVPSVEAGIGTKALVSGSGFPSDRSIVLSSVSEDISGRTQSLFIGETFRNTGDRFWQGTAFWPGKEKISLLGYSGEGMENVNWDEDDPTAGIEMDVPDNSTLQEDILVGCVDDNPRMPWVEMKMRHVFSLLTFSAQSDGDFDPVRNAGISINSITITSVAFSGHLTVKRDGSGLDVIWSEIPDGAKKVIGGIVDEELNTFETEHLGEPLLIVPSEQKTIIIKYRYHMGFDEQGKPINQDVEYTVTPRDGWLAGSCTNYLIRITMNEVSLTPRVVPWNVDWHNVEI